MTKPDGSEASSKQEDATHTVSLISYVLHLIVAVSAIIPGAQVGPVLLVVALILDFVKRGDAGDGWEASHFSYRIRTVIWAAVLYLVTAPLWFFFILPGWLAWAVISVWFLYRIVLGWVRLNKQQPMDV
ncbi:COG3671 Predicted membrane protein [Burkholderiaceae bacterium]